MFWGACVWGNKMKQVKSIEIRLQPEREPDNYFKFLVMKFQVYNNIFVLVTEKKILLAN